MMQIMPTESVGTQDEQQHNHHDEEDDDMSANEGATRVLPWRRQITVRGLVMSSVIGCMYSVIAMKLSLTTGITPNFNVSAALVAFLFVRTWTKLLHRFGIGSVPFTRQENTMIQTCAVACYTIAVGGGLGTYLLGMNKKMYELTGGANTVGNSPTSYKQPGIAWLIVFLLVTSFVGLFVLIPLRKILIIDYKLTFPTGMATAVLINGFHSKKNKMARKQVKGFVKFLCYTFLWSFFQWFYTGKDNCGFSQFPTFGLQAWKKSFYFDFSMTNVGTGMICSHIVNVSMLVGAVLSWGVMWPLMEKHKGLWFPSDLPESSMKSLNGYKVFISIALLLGDGLYNLIKMLCITLLSIQGRIKNTRQNSDRVEQNKNHDDQAKKDEVFVRERIPMWVGVVGYTAFSIVAVVVIPMIFHQVKWYWVILAYVLSPTLAFCNAYGAGLTDMNMAYNYGKVGLFVMAALAGKENGVMAGLAGIALVKSIVNISVNLMIDFKTGHLTLTSPRAMLVSQAVGTLVGCVVAPLSFFLFYNAFDIGNPNGKYKAPYALVYRNLAIVSVQGFSALPMHCLQLCYGFFGLAVLINLVRDLSLRRLGRWMPLPTAMAVPFLIGGYVGVDMCVGSVIVYVWGKMNSKKAELMVPAVASGMICGEGLWTLPASVLALAKVSPPICMKFLPS